MAKCLWQLEEIWPEAAVGQRAVKLDGSQHNRNERVDDGFYRFYRGRSFLPVGTTIHDGSISEPRLVGIVESL